MENNEDYSKSQLLHEVKQLRFQNSELENKLTIANQLIQSEAKFKSYFDHSPDGVFIVNEKGQYIEVNEAACTMSGYSESELLKMAIPDLLQPTYQQAAQGHFQKVVSEGHASGSFGYLKKTGENVFWSVDAVKLSEGRFMGFVRDITPLREALDKNKEQNTFFETVINSLTYPFYVIDADTYEVKATNTASGAKLTESNDRLTCYQISHNNNKPCDSTCHPCPLEIVKQTGKPAVVEHQHIDKRGNSFFAEVHAYPILNDQGHVNQIIEYSIDITEKKKTEMQLRKSEERFRQIFENSPDIIVIHDSEKIVYVNKNGLKIAGVQSSDEIVGKTALQFVHPDYRPKATENIRKLFTHELDKSFSEEKFILPNGKIIDVEVSGVPFIYENQQMVQLVARDVSDRKNLHEKIRASETLLQHSFDALSAHIAVLDNNGTILSVNHAWKDFVEANGLSEANHLVGHNYLTISKQAMGPFSDEGPRALSGIVDVIEGRKKEFSLVYPCHSLKEKRWFNLKVTKFGSGSNMRVVLAHENITELVEKEAELIKLSAAMQQSPALIAITDLNGKIQYVNPKFTELTGYSLHEASGMPTSILRSGDHTEDYYKNLWETISAGHTWHGEFHNKKKNGELFWESASISPIFNKEGNITSYIKVGEDITQRKRIEDTQKILLDISKTANLYQSLYELLEAIHQKIKRVLRAENFYVALYNPSDNTYSLPYHVDEVDTLELNKAYDFSNGLTDYVYKTNRSMIITPDNHEIIAGHGFKGYGSNRSVWLGVPLKPSETAQPIGVITIQDYQNYTPYSESDQAVFEIIAYHIFGFIERVNAIQDIIHAKEIAELNEGKFKLLNQLTSEMLLLNDIDSIYQFIADSLHQHYPNTIALIVSVDEANRDTKLEYFCGLDNHFLIKAVKLTGFSPVGRHYPLTDFHNQYLKSGQLYEFEEGLFKFTGATIPEFVARVFEEIINIQKIYSIGINKDNELLAAVHLFTTKKDILVDKTFIEIFVKQTGLVLQKKITEQILQVAKEKAEESDKLKSAFLANMSHEIRTPMNGILGFLDLIKEPKMDEAVRNNYIDIVHQSGESLLSTINDIIEISRIESGDIPLTISNVDLRPLLEFHYDFFRQQANKKGLQLVLAETDQNVSDFSCDKNKLDSILTNLIRNAIKFTEKGNITFGYALKSGNIEFFVKDTGIGIPKDRREAIFDRFIQADIEDRRAYQGSGLGLSIVKGYVEKLNGKIWLESSLNKGTTFYVSLPRHQSLTTSTLSHTQAHAMPGQLQLTKNTEKLKVLIVEDDETSILFIETILDVRKYEVLKAYNGEEAVNMVQKKPDISLILMDLKMPVMNGYNATRKIREFNKNVVIIAQTAFALSGDRKKAIDAGCNDYISKPIKKEKLQNIINDYFGQ